MHVHWHNTVLTLLFAFASAAMSSDTPDITTSSALPAEPTCWTGHIHDKCNGSKTGCAVGGIFVRNFSTTSPLGLIY